MCSLSKCTKLHRIMPLALQKLKKRAHKSPEISDKPPKKSSRFDGSSEKEIMEKKSSLSDILDYNLDLVFIGINPSLMAAYTGRYYAGPGNHFYKLLYESQLIPEPITYENDSDLLKYKIGLTNIVARATRSSADLSRTELKKGAAAVHDKLKKFKPKIACFNGKCIYEEFADKYDKSSFKFGLQPSRVGETVLWVVPSSSARCANFPRMQDKLHFYTSMKKYLAYMNGEIKEVNPEEFHFDGKCRQPVPSTSKMWRRKDISAFAFGGRIANKETVNMDTSDENMFIPCTNEFILQKKENEESDSGISASQSSVENFQRLSQISESDIIQQESSLNTENEVANQKISRENEVENNEGDSKEQNDTKRKKKLQSNRRLSKNKLTSRNAAVNANKERSETIDFISLIKQRLSNKGEVADDEAENQAESALPSVNIKGLKYQNLRSDKSKCGFTLKTKC